MMSLREGSFNRNVGMSEQHTVSAAIRRSMQGNRGKHTRPELAVRRIVHAMGFRYRLHRKDLPGRPDMTFPGRQAVIEIRGCFWHRHLGCRLAYLPKTRTDFWQRKFETTVLRDDRNAKALENSGWRVLTVWECEIDNAKLLANRLRTFLESGPHRATEE